MTTLIYTTAGAQGPQGVPGLQGPKGDPGPVDGPGAVADHSVARWNGTAGDMLDQSAATIDDNGNISTPGSVNGRDLVADGAKLDHLTVTAATDLDAIRARVDDLDAAVVLRGGWDAAVGTFPGGGSAQAGDAWLVTGDGTVDTIAFSQGDRIIALVDAASANTYSGNWVKADYTDRVSSVAGRTGNVTLASDDIADSGGTGRALVTAASASAAIAALGGSASALDDYLTSADLAGYASLSGAAFAGPVSFASDLTFNAHNAYSIGTAADRVANVWVAGTVVTGSLSAQAGGTMGFNGDTLLTRDGIANTLAQRNGANPQAFNLYNNWANIADWERLSLHHAGDVAFMVTQQAGSGLTRQLVIGTEGDDAALILRTDNTDRWEIEGTDGHFLARTDGTYDIGTAGANRPRDVHAARNLKVGGAEIDFTGLPTADPAVAGRLWNDAGTVKISAG